MLRALIVAAILCVSFETSGLGASFGDGGCGEECPTEIAGGECAPNCQQCACCSLPKTMSALVVVPASPCPDVGHVSWTSNTRQPPAPDPRDILHVPRRLAV